MPRNTPLRFIGKLRQRHHERKANRRAKLRGLLGGGGGTADSLPGGMVAGGMLGGFGAGGSSGGGGMFGVAHDIFGAKPKATEAGVPEHSHVIEDTDAESPMAKKLKFGRKK